MQLSLHFFALAVSLGHVLAIPVDGITTASTDPMLVGFYGTSDTLVPTLQKQGFVGLSDISEEELGKGLYLGANVAAAGRRAGKFVAPGAKKTICAVYAKDLWVWLRMPKTYLMSEAYSTIFNKNFEENSPESLAAQRKWIKQNAPQVASIPDDKLVKIVPEVDLYYLSKAQGRLFIPIGQLDKFSVGECKTYETGLPTLSEKPIDYTSLQMHWNIRGVYYKEPEEPRVPGFIEKLWNKAVDKVDDLIVTGVEVGTGLHGLP